MDELDRGILDVDFPAREVYECNFSDSVYQ